MLVKNQELEINIDSLGNEGEGIGKTEEGMTVFVTDALPGDRVLVHITKAKKTYAYGFAVKVLSPSPFRVTAKCPVAKKCGGCTLLHLSYEKQLEYKEAKVRDCIERIGGFSNPPFEKIIGADTPYFYRNKAQFPVGRDKEGKAVIGFYRKRSHDVVANLECCIQNEINEDILSTVENFLNKYNIPAYDETSQTGLVRHVFTRVGKSTGQVMVCLVINGKSLPKAEVLTDLLLETVSKKGLSLSSYCLNVNTKDTNVIMGKECIPIYGPLYIEDYIGTVRYRISPLSFYQVNPEQTGKLYNLAKEYAGLTGEEILWDLYCGIGTISLYLSDSAKEVYGVEIVPEAIEDAKKNAEINNITNAHFYVGASEDVADTLPAPDVIVVDPPRKGCDEKLLQTIVKVSPKRLVYVSCDPATLARDLKYLCSNGFTFEKIRPVDQFCHTMHVETVCLLSNRKADSYVNIGVDVEDYYKIKSEE